MGIDLDVDRRFLVTCFFSSTIFMLGIRLLKAPIYAERTQKACGVDQIEIAFHDGIARERLIEGYGDVTGSNTAILAAGAPFSSCSGA